MSIPDYQTVMLPMLSYLADEKEHTIKEATENISNFFNLSEKARAELLPSGRQTIIYSRVGWAKTYLKKAGLLRQPRRGVILITDRGLQVLKENPEKIDINFLKQFPEFLDFKSSETASEEVTIQLEPIPGQTPLEALEQSYQQLKNELIEEILENLHNVTPEFFERLVVELLVKMGYGGSLKEVGKAIGGVGDEGIDGVIKEDRLGLDKLYVQAKRWKNSVGRPVVQAFVGALQGQKARKGIMITTSQFTREAKEYVEKIDAKVALVNGSLLANLMIDYDLGVTPRDTYTIKEIDNDYFQLFYQ